MVFWISLEVVLEGNSNLVVVIELFLLGEIVVMEIYIFFKGIERLVVISVLEIIVGILVNILLVIEFLVEVKSLLEYISLLISVFDGILIDKIGVVKVCFFFGGKVWLIFKSVVWNILLLLYNEGIICWEFSFLSKIGLKYFLFV